MTHVTVMGVCACGCVGRCVHVAVLGGKGVGKGVGKENKICACNHVTVM